MTQILFLKVKEGLTELRNPLDGMVLIPGVVYELPASQFWLKRLEQGDVVAVAVQADSKEKKSKAKKGE